MFYKSLSIVVFFGVFLAPVNDAPIEWRDHYKLTWSQFRGQPKTNTAAVAVTASGITFEYSVKESDMRIVSFDAKVYAHFYPNKSWYIKEEGNAHILAHEQLHFDITELYARKFRKQLLQLKVTNNLKSQLRTMQEQINSEWAVTQNRYDKESDNSVNKEFQMKWNTYITQELTKLDAFKSKD
jgi:hypothetical protein